LRERFDGRNWLAEQDLPVTELDARWDFEHAIETFAVQNEEK